MCARVCVCMCVLIIIFIDSKHVSFQIVNALPHNPRVPPMVPNIIHVNPTTITTNRATVLPLYPIANMREGYNNNIH